MIICLFHPGIVIGVHRYETRYTHVSVDLTVYKVEQLAFLSF